MLRHWYWSAVFWLVLSLCFGVLARELTRALAFSGQTSLFLVHGHALALGFGFSLLMLILTKIIALKCSPTFFWAFQVSFFILIATMATRGILTVYEVDFPGLNHIAGLGHFSFAIVLIWFLRQLYLALLPQADFH